MVALGKLWATGAYFNPLVGAGQVDWDAQVVSSIPAVRAAKTSAEYRSAVTQLVKAFPEPPQGGLQRLWMHYDFASSAFVYRSGAAAAPVPVDMGGGVTVPVSLAEAVQSGQPSVPALRHDADLANVQYPSTELRILAAYRLWGAVHYFFAYRDLMDADWDDEFPKFLHAFIGSKDAREYHLAVAQAVTKLDDSNTEAQSPLLDEYFGTAGVPLRLRVLDKKPIVTEVWGDTAGIQVGDIVLRVDGEEIVQRINREAAFLPASTHQALAELVAQHVLDGAPDSEAVLTVRHHDGAEADVKLKRSRQPAHEDHSSVVKQLSGKVGYIDLTRLDPGSVDGAFAAVAAKPALILDARGALLVDPNQIAAKLNTKTDAAGAIVTGAILLSPDLPTPTALTHTNSFFSVESVPSGQVDYKGKLLMLIDGRTINQMERLGLYLEAAKRIVFVGSDSAGACSTLSYLSLPGGIRVQFSATDVRHGNSGKLQRLGLTPAEAASPELGDVRAGRDVVLEKAIEYLDQHE